MMIGIATLIFALEDFSLRDVLGPSDPRAWAAQRREIDPRLVRRVLDVLYSQRGLTLTLAARAAASLGLIASLHAGDAVVLIAGQWLWSVRWRGTFNGGSDAMTLIVLIGTLIGSIDPSWQRAGMIYVAVHLVTAFVVAGLAKLRNPEWRTGRAPRIFASDAGLAKISTGVARCAGWLVIGFECSFPAAVLHPTAAGLYTAAGMSFHLINAYVFGLNRFLLAWAAAYPALIALAS